MTNHEGHVKLWDELARTGSDDKETAFDTFFPDAPDVARAYACFACQESSDRDSISDCIKGCPIQWASPNGCCRDGSEYKQWDEAVTPDERKRLAAIIRDLPWREK